MNEQKHIIHRQVLELTIPERGHAQSIQNKTSEIVKYKLKPALDNLFSKLSSSDKILRIDKLVIDLGTITENDFEKILVEKSINEIGKKLNQLKNSGLIDKGNKPVNGHSTDESDRFSTTSKSADMLEQFVYFLQFGRFPWWHKSEGSSAKHGTSQLDKIFAEVLKYKITVLKSSILPLLNKSSARKRLVFQLTHSQLDALLHKLNSKLISSYNSLFQILLSSLKSTKERNNLTESFYKITLQYFGAEQELKNNELKIGFVKEMLEAFFTKYSFDENETLLIEILESLQIKQSQKTSENSNLAVVAVVQSALKFNAHNQVLQKIIQEILAKSDSRVKDLVTNDTIDAKIKNEEKPFSLFPPKPTDVAEGIIVSNAGLVLIHPFLRYFFDGLGLLDKELQFKSQSDVFKAIHLLQYVVTGSEVTEEAELPLNKILCGLEITDPIPNSFPLSEQDKEECINLIKTVLQRWEALKTTNPEALRGTYIQREGILNQSEQSWSLIIERSSFDVMLEKLPWSINLIKLPWLSKILYVEW